MSGKLNKPIMLRLSEEVVESVELAAKAEGLIIQDWIRKAIDYYLINMTNTCPKCRTYNSRDSRYCKKCGEKLTNIPQRMVKEIYDVLVNFTVRLRDYTNNRDIIKSNKEFDLVQIQKLIIHAENLIKTWSDVDMIFQISKEGILQSDIDSEVKKDLEHQTSIVDDINSKISDITMDLIEYKKIIDENQESQSKNNLDE
ncbi:MAG: zinc ribbon domain-containing protein [Spirochaetia bacterium]|nr:zinc ribbon domain-containing protein [Spirochaetia bacterium]